MFEQYKKVKDELCGYVSKWIDIARECHEENFVKELETQLNELRKLRFNIAVLGNIKRGKSTLINTLLGRSDDTLSPIDWKVCTGGIVHYINTDSDEKQRGRECADVYFKDGRVVEDIDLADIGDYIREENNPENRKGISRVMVYGDFPRLHECCLVDTPGANAVVEHHGELVFDFLPHADAIIMTTMASQPLGDADQQILRELSKDRQKRIFYLVTKIDNENEADRDTILRHVSTEIEKTGLPKPKKLYPIACKKVFDAMKEGNTRLAEEMREKWGVANFEKDLETFITSESREGRNIGENLLDTLARLKEVIAAKKTANEEIIRIQDIDIEQIKKERERIEKEFDTLRKGIEKQIAKFEREWDHCARRTIEGTDNLSLRLEDNMHAVIDRGGMLTSIKNLFSLNQVLQRAMQEPIADFLDKHTEKLQKVIDALGDDINEEFNIFKTRVKESDITGMVGGAALLGATGWAISGAVTAGIGVANAAAAATTAVATAAPWYSSLPAIGGVVSNWITGTASATTAAKAGLIAAITGSIVPLAIAVAALWLTGPLAKIFAGMLIPKKVDKALQDLKSTLEKQLSAYKGNILDEIRRQIDEADAKRRVSLDECAEKLADLSPETKAKAVEENKRLEELQHALESNETDMRHRILRLA